MGATVYRVFSMANLWMRMKSRSFSFDPGILPGRLDLGQQFQIDGVSVGRDLPQLHQTDDSTARFGPVPAVAEATAHLTMLFEAGEVAGQLLRRDIHQPEIPETG